jgi:hypothetical protein
VADWLARRLPSAYRLARAIWEHVYRFRQARRHAAPYPTNAAKLRILREHARRYGLANLVESGTALGETAWALRRRFDRVYTIELDPRLCRRARARFARSPNVTVLEGDSGIRLAEVLAELHGPTLFWLDSHVQRAESVRGELPTPAAAELGAIVSRGLDGHVVLIDDARLFSGRDGWPSVEELRSLAGGARFEVAEDVIRISAR